LDQNPSAWEASSSEAILFNFASMSKITSEESDLLLRLLQFFFQFVQHRFSVPLNRTIVL
jgi:hypothetical protein